MRFELLAMRAVVDPFPRRGHPLAGSDHRGVADNRDQVAMPARLYAEHTKAVVGVVERHPFNQAGQHLAWRQCPGSQCSAPHTPWCWVTRPPKAVQHPTIWACRNLSGKPRADELRPAALPITVTPC